MVRLPQQPLLAVLVALLPLMVAGRPIQEATSFLLSLTLQSNLADASTAEEVHRLWAVFLGVIPESSVSDLLQVVLKYTLAQSSLKSPESFVGVVALTFIFERFPDATAALLLPILCRSYDREIPSDYRAFLKYVEVAEVDFSISPDEIVAYNALSQILLLIEDKQLFHTLFVEKLAQLTLFAVLFFDIDSFAIGPFHPLLDTLLDAALFRFAPDTSSFTRNLQTLQESNLILRANSLDVQYQILTGISESKHILAYDQTAVKSLASLFCQADPAFSQKLFALVLANAFKVRDCERALEPFLILMALDREVTTRSLLYLLQFAVFAFTRNRTEVVDPLVDIIRGRLLSDTLDPAVFAAEVVPVIVVFLLYLSLNCRRSLSMHIVCILADVCRKVLSLGENAKGVSSQLNKFLARYRGDEYVASLFLRFLVETPTFGDNSVPDMVRALGELAQVMGAAEGTPYNWCMVLALLVDGVRFFIGEKCQRPQTPALELPGLVWSDAETFAGFLSQHFRDLKQRAFVVQFLGAFVKHFRCGDLYRESAALTILYWFLKRSEFVMDPVTMDNVIAFSFLVGFACDDAAKLLGYLLARLNHTLPNTSITLEALAPVFVPVTFKTIGHWQGISKVVVDTAKLPPFVLFQMVDVSTNDIVTTLYDHIGALLSGTP
jgi:hypothetical protein